MPIKNIAEGLSSGEIADKLFIAESTVKQHRKNILAKAECKNTV
ncbi:response regulator transcription factor [Pedobacter africanus]